MLHTTKRAALLCAVTLIAAVAQAQAQQEPVERIGARETLSMVTGSTITFEGRDNHGDFRTQIYTAPNGTGWHVYMPLPGSTAQPQQFRVLATYATGQAGWCRIRTQAVRMMPRETAATWACNELMRDAEDQLWLLAARHNEGDPPRRVVSIEPGDQTPPEARQTWETEVRARYGGELPTWQAPRVAPPARNG